MEILKETKKMTQKIKTASPITNKLLCRLLMSGCKITPSTRVHHYKVFPYFMKKILTLIMGAALLLPSYNIHAQKKRNEHSAPKVLILNFNDVGGGGKIRFLTLTSGDVFLEKFMNRGNYEIIPKTKAIRAAKKLRINPKQWHQKRYAVRIGDLTNADIVVTGTYSIKRNRYKFIANAYNMANEKGDSSSSYSAKVNSSAFKGFNELASNIVRRISKQVPPDKKSRSNKPRWSGYSRFNPVISISPVAAIPFSIDGSDVSNIDIGFGFKGGWQPPPLAKWAYFYFELELISFTAQGDADPYWLYGINLGPIFPIHLGENFVLAPYVLLGVNVMSQNGSVVTDGPQGKGGLSLRFYPWKSFGIILDAYTSINLGGGGGSSDPNYVSPYSLDNAPSLLNFSIGATFRFK